MSTLFVVDDNPIDQYIIKFNLVKNPVFSQVCYYNGGLPLIEYLVENKDNPAGLPDAVFVDLCMPGYDGWDVLDALKVIYRMLSKKINVYILSASIFSNDIARSKNYDFVKQFISKPITRDSLISISKEI